MMSGGDRPREFGNESGGEQTSDAALVELIRDRDQHALEELYDRHASTVYSIAIGILKDGARAEDVAQDVFMTLWNQPGRYDPAIGRFAPWFYRVARNRSIDILRRLRREVRPGDQQVFETTVPDTDPSPSDVTLMRSEAERVRLALRQLSVDQRQLIELAYFSGMTQSEMARHLNIPLGTVKTRVRTALRRLRGMLEENDQRG